MWTLKKKRQTRRDKGKPKKSIVSVLLGENSTTENRDENPALESTTVCEKEDAVLQDDDVLKQCYVKLSVLNESLAVSG